MHAGMDEPELLMQLLETIAIEKARGDRPGIWQAVARHAQACVRELELLNETPSRR